MRLLAGPQLIGVACSSLASMLLLRLMLKARRGMPRLCDWLAALFKPVASTSLAAPCSTACCLGLAAIGKQSPAAAAAAAACCAAGQLPPLPAALPAKLPASHVTLFFTPRFFLGCVLPAAGLLLLLLLLPIPSVFALQAGGPAAVAAAAAACAGRNEPGSPAVAFTPAT